MELENMARLRGRRLRGEADRLEESRRRVGLGGGDSHSGVKGMKGGGRIGLKLLRACLHVMHIADGEIILSFARSACHSRKRLLRSHEGTMEQPRDANRFFFSGERGSLTGTQSISSASPFSHQLIPTSLGALSPPAFLSPLSGGLVH